MERDVDGDRRSGMQFRSAAGTGACKAATALTLTHVVTSTLFSSSQTQSVFTTETGPQSHAWKFATRPSPESYSPPRARRHGEGRGCMVLLCKSSDGSSQEGSRTLLSTMVTFVSHGSATAYTVSKEHLPPCTSCTHHV